MNSHNGDNGVKSAFPAPHVAPVTIYPKQLETSHVSQLVTMYQF